MMKETTRRTFARYLIPSMFTMLLVGLYAFTDSFLIGRRLGSVALGAMGICTPVLTIAYAFGFLFGMGGASLYSISMGQGDKKRSNSIFSTALMSMLIFAVTIAVILNVKITEFAIFLGADNENISYVISYLRVLLVCLPVFTMDVFMSSFMNNEGHPIIAMIASATGTGLNVILAFVFVFVFDWGMFGAAFATALCSGIGCTINIISSFAGKMNITLHLKNIDFSELWRILRNGFSVFILESSSAIVTFVFIMQANKLYGSIGSAVYTIVMNWSLIVTYVVLGISRASQPLISVSYGQGRIDLVKAYRKYAVLCAVGMGIFFDAVGYAFTKPLVSVFTIDDREVIRLATDGLRFYLPAFIFMGIAICVGIYFQSIDYAGESFIIMLSRGVVLPVLGAFLLTAVWGKNGLWITVPCAEFITAVIALVLLHRHNVYSVAAKEK
ncbi:MATE family efflux transporter [Clostridium estertheticum]|uniref:MATE family efflux transporter n=1 Tax=Clostridium estertheticum TaxID=238834 RepID=UPI001C0E6594|nr:MATE family efflux transporter [Clostridium estertheticum]MBU3174624.1 MATE family efflux transporter [Clostridium estertheticum]